MDDKKAPLNPAQVPGICQEIFDDDAIIMGDGAMGKRVSDPFGLKSAIKRAIASGKCSVIHVDVDPAKHESFVAL